MHHDHVPAKAAGLANAWIDRQRLSEGGNWGATAEVPEMPETDVIFFDDGDGKGQGSLKLPFSSWP